MENSSLAHARMLTCYTIFRKQIIPYKDSGDSLLMKARDLGYYRSQKH